MTNPIFPVPIDKPIFNLTSIVTYPLGEEIWLALMTFISIFLILWILSNIFHFEKQDYKTPLFIAIIVSLTSFMIRSSSLIFSLTDIQKPIINKIAMMVEIFLLLFLIKKAYNLKWLKSILTLVITYFVKFIIMGIITIIILFFFTTIPKDIAEERSPKMSIDDFEINSYGEKTGDNEFIVYENKIISNERINVVNLKSKINFPVKTENVNMDLDCYLPHAKLFSDGLKDYTKEYKFKSFDYGIGFNVEGSAYFMCNNCIMNSDSTSGTGIISIESTETAIINFDFLFKAKVNREMECFVDIMNKKPGYSLKKRFIIKYIADSIE